MFRRLFGVFVASQVVALPVTRRGSAMARVQLARETLRLVDVIGLAFFLRFFSEYEFRI